MTNSVTVSSDSSLSENNRKTEEKVGIVLGFKDGQEFIMMQLDGIFRQKYDNFHIHIFDDCSTFEHVDTLISENIDSQNASKISYQRRENRLGFCANFLNGLKSISDDFAYYAFCDQDDIWGETKLERAITTLKQYPQDTPALYCSRTEIVDQSGEVHLGYSPLFTRQPSFANALVQNVGGGNTMVMNKVARDLIIRASENVEVVSHDWWAYIIITGAGGNVYYDPIPSLKYRQHDNNLIGANNSISARIRRIHLLFKGNLRHWNEMHVQALQTKEHLLSAENLHIFHLFVEARQASLFGRMWGFKKAGVYRQTLLGNIGLYFAMLLKLV